MDVERGLCWRCEDKKSDKGKKCSRCNIAEYCGEHCRERDKLRHQVECDMWNRNRKQCSACGNETVCIWCSACREVAYCGVDCQRADRKRHKSSCLEIRKAFYNIVTNYSLRMLSWRRQTKIHSYFSQTIAVYVLKLNLNEAKRVSSIDAEGPLARRDYNVLFGDVGDLGSMLLTTASLPKDFTGNVRYKLADISPFVMARNVLFIYMMVTQSSRDAIEETVTNIWYSLQLPDEDFHFLVSMLKELAVYDVDTLKSKTSGELLLNQDNLSKIKEVWSKWLELECDTGKWNSIDLVGQRTNLFRNGIWSSNSELASGYCQLVPERHGESTATYFVNGLFLKGDCETSLRFDNPTLTGPPLLSCKCQQISTRAGNLEYCIPPLDIPFRGWDYIRASKMFKNEDSIVKLFHGYITSVVRNAVSFIKRHQISFNCCVGDFTLLYKESDVKPKYDRIAASQAVDVVGFKQLLSSMRPLLSTTNKHAVLLMETHGWFQFIPEADVYHPVNRERAYQILEVVRSETGCQELNKLQLYSKDDYFDNTSLFIRFLRAVFSATTYPIVQLCVGEPIPNVPVPSRCLAGFKLRDFTKGLNKVIPFKYRQNARLCNIIDGYQRNLEWHL